MKYLLPVALTIGLWPAIAHAQGTSTNQVRLELRLVVVRGTAGVSLTKEDTSGVFTFGMPLRLEAQYRIVDLDTNDAFVPSGLVSGNLRLTTTAGTLSRAALTRNQAGGTGAPPVSQSVDLVTDTSPLAANGATGLHRPFRGGFPAPPPNNDNPANGVFENGNRLISGITPLVLSQTDQNDGGWYGLYSFVYHSAGTTALVEASFDADAMTGNRFGFFNDSDPVPVTSPVSQGDLIVIDFPSPSSATLLLIGGAMSARRRRSIASR